MFQLKKLYRFYNTKKNLQKKVLKDARSIFKDRRFDEIKENMFLKMAKNILS